MSNYFSKLIKIIFFGGAIFIGVTAIAAPKVKDFDENSSDELVEPESSASVSSPTSKKAFGIAAGFGLGWQARRDYGAADRDRFYGEIPVYAYFHLLSSLYLRPGLRIFYSNSQPEMPGAIKLSETDLGILAEAGLLWDSYVIPSFSFSYGQVRRTIRLETGPDLDPGSFPARRSENLQMLALQLGVGVPALSGLVVLEPYVRFFNLQEDDRAHWAYGLEATLSLY